MATPVDNNRNDNDPPSDPSINPARVLTYPANGTPARFANFTPVYTSNEDPQLTHLTHFPDFGVCWRPDGLMDSRCMKYTIQNPDGSPKSTSYVAFWSVSKQLPPNSYKARLDRGTPSAHSTATGDIFFVELESPERDEQGRTRYKFHPEELPMRHWCDRLIAKLGRGTLCELMEIPNA
ncbi:MAG: hypothetical protein Q9187_003335 [Circinaria calcarea]